MPTYEYECSACGHSFEKFQSITAATARKCPACGKLKLRRLIGSGSGIIFRGSGFYQTDYRSAAYRKEAGAATTSGSSTTTSGDKSKSSGDASSTSSSSSSKKAPVDKAAG